MKSISKNFGFVKSFLIKDENLTKAIEGDILIMEQAFKAKKYEEIARQARINAETILQYILGEESGTLKYLTDKMNKTLTVPLEVVDAIHQIRKFSNNASHSNRLREKTFLMDIDDNDAIQILKSIFRINKYATMWTNEERLYEEEMEEIKEWKFDKSIYIPTTKDEVLEGKFESIDDSTQVHLKSLLEIIDSTGQFVIPTYQRKYTWTTKEIDVLLGDINLRMKDKKQHYMGALAIARRNHDRKISRIIDGQQRITTSLILSKAIRDVLVIKSWKVPQELEDLNNVFHKKYINNASINNDQRFVNEILSLDINHVSNNIPDVEFRKSCAYINYTYLMQYLKSQDQSYVIEFFTTFANYFVAAELVFDRQIDDEIDIFENLNSKGTELSDWALIKNYFFTRFEANALIENEIAIEQIIKAQIAVPAATKLGSDWDIKIKNFFNIYNRIQFIKQKNKISDNKEVPHKIFKEVWPEGSAKFTTTFEFEKELWKVKRYLKIYKIIKSQEFMENAYSPLSFAKLHLKNLNEKEVHYPLIIEMIHKNIIWDGPNIVKVEKQKQILSLLKVLDFYVTKLLVVKGTGQSLGSVFDKILLDFGEDVDSIARKTWERLNNLNGDNSMPSLEAFVDALKNPINKDKSMSILRSIEEYYSKIGSNVKKHVILVNPTLEHIFPKTPDSTWSRGGLPEVLFKRKLKNEFVDKIGNHIILGRRLNIKASNNSFLIKRKLYNEETTVLIRGNNSLEGMPLQNLLLKDSFRFSDINRRTEQIQKICKVVYKDLF